MAINSQCLNCRHTDCKFARTIISSLVICVTYYCFPISLNVGSSTHLFINSLRIYLSDCIFVRLRHAVQVHSCSVLPGRSGSQHFQCSTTPTLDCSDLPHSLLPFFCLLICLLVSVSVCVRVCVCVSARLQQIGPPWPLALVSFRSAPSDRIPSDQRPRIEPPRLGTPSLLSLLGSYPSAR
jgi:hypothetical protein